MPGSFNNFDMLINFIVKELKPENFLDIGCGAGKYGKLVSEQSPNTRKTGIEIESSYIQKYSLQNIYNEVRVGDALDLLQKNNETFDFIVIGDCIEHMLKSRGIDLLNLLTYRCQYLVVLTPDFIIQNDVGGVESESHVSVWSEVDFQWHDRWAWDNCYTISCFLLRGYQKSCLDFESLVDTINSSDVPIIKFYNNEEVVRFVDLKKIVRYHFDVKDDRVLNWRPK